MANKLDEVMKMTRLKRVGTTYLPVSNLKKATEWYTSNLEAEISYHDDEKTILNFADQSFFLIPAAPDQSNSFIDAKGTEWFGLGFEVDGEENLLTFHQDLLKQGVKAGDIESRGHAGKNFRFWDEDGNAFDVWSEWKERGET
ncbi:VOC family protein [Chryseomicrobium palamuruense]|uniref:VOC family protein n=1 Tax=Chryseomicrobium palamuruense TaxID=682973 RepID=A0ABV8URL3_9BACL